MRMNKKLQMCLLKRYFLHRGVDSDLIDWEAEVDSSLRLYENISFLKEKYALLMGTEWRFYHEDY